MRERTVQWLRQGGKSPHWVRLLILVGAVYLCNLGATPFLLACLTVQMLAMAWIGWAAARAWNALALIIALRKEGTLELGSLAGLAAADVLTATVTRVNRIMLVGLTPFILVMLAAAVGDDPEVGLGILGLLGFLASAVIVISHLVIWLSAPGAKAWQAAGWLLGSFILATVLVGCLASTHHASQETLVLATYTLAGLFMLGPSRRQALRSLEPATLPAGPGRRRRRWRRSGTENPILYRLGLRWGWSGLLSALLLVSGTLVPTALVTAAISGSTPVGFMLTVTALVPGLFLAWFTMMATAWIVYRESRERTLELFLISRVKAPAAVDGYTWFAAAPHLVSVLAVTLVLVVSVPSTAPWMAAALPSNLLMILMGGYAGQFLGWRFRDRLWALGGSIFLSLWFLEVAMLLPSVAAPEALRPAVPALTALVCLFAARQACLKASSHGHEVGFTPA